MILEPDAAEYLIEQGYNPDFGARPLKRTIERLVEDPLSEQILKGEYKEKTHPEDNILSAGHKTE